MHDVEILASLFEQAKQAHVEAFAHVDGHDPEWARWYAEWLHPKLAAHLTRPPSIEQLADLLTAMAEAHGSESSDPHWPRFYAEYLLAQDGTAAP